MKKFLITLIAICTMLFAFGMVTASAARSGTCGANLTWTLDDFGTLTISGQGAMSDYYYSLNAPWSSLRNDITKIIIDAGVTSIGNYAFRGCSGLESVTIRNKVISIANSTFHEGVIRIGDLAFWGCSSLSSITVPESIKSIGNGAFSVCNSLESVNINNLESWCNIDFEDSDSNPLCHGGGLYLDGDLLTYIVIPEGVTSIGEHVFSGYSSLLEVTIPNSVTSIGDYAFSDCSNLTSVTISDSVKSVGHRTFYQCRSLSNITIGTGVTSIGSLAFESCKNLENITIPESVTSIGYDAFYGCNSLKSINVNSNNMYFSSDNGVLFNKNKTLFICYPAGKTESQYSIPNSVTSIGDSAFVYCSRVVGITIPNSVKTIGDYAFFSCSSLENITIPDGVTNIGEGTFYQCKSLVNITIPDSIIIIGDSAFYMCSSLADVYYNNSKEEWNKISIGSNNEVLENAIMHFNPKGQGECRINEIAIKDMLGNSLDTIPIGTFLATVSFADVSSSEDAVIILAQYTDAGAFKGLVYIQIEDLLTGSTINLSIPVDNSKGDIAKLKAFCWESFGSMNPMSNSVSFPVE